MVHINDSVTQVGAEVNEQRELVVRSIGETELEHASLHGRGYTWDSTELDLVAAEKFLSVKNLSDTPLIIDRVIFNGSNVACIWTIHTSQATTTPAGTIVTGVNMNTSFSSTLANAIAHSDETAVADGDIVARVKTVVLGHHVHPMNGHILGKNHTVQIIQVTESTSGSVIIVGHFANPS